MYLMYRVYMMETKCLGRIQVKMKFEEVECGGFSLAVLLYI